MDSVNSVIFGTLLGDAAIVRDKTTYALVACHSERQWEYLEWKARAIGHHLRFQERKSGFGSKMKVMSYHDLHRLERVYDICIENGVKRVSPEWISNLDVLSLAVWYQDDGSWGKAGKKRDGDRVQRRISFSVCGFDEPSCRLLVAWLHDSFGLTARLVTRKDKYRMLDLYHRSAIRLWELVAPYLTIRTKVDSKKKPSGGHWFDVRSIGSMAESIASAEKPPKRIVLRPNLKSKSLRFIACKGITTHLNDWARRTGLKRETISSRLRRGLSPTEALGYS